MSSKAKKGLKNEFLSKEKKDWTVADVQNWLESLDLGIYAAAFAREAIEGDSLLELKPEDLDALGVIKLGHRKKLLMEIKGEESLMESSHSDSHHNLRLMRRGSELLAASSSDTADMIILKAIFGGDIRKIRLTKGSRFLELEAEIKERFGLRKVLLKYSDAEGDKMTLSSEREWEECLKETGGRLVLYVSDGKSSTTSSSSSPSKKKPSKPKRTSSKSSSKPANFALYFSVFDGLLQATIVIDEKGIMYYANAACEKITGYTKLELLGKNVTMLMPEEYARYHEAYIRNYLRTGDAKVIGKGRNVTLVKKDDSYIPIYLELTENTSTGQVPRVLRFKSGYGWR